jgi:hypothetical protein
MGVGYDVFHFCCIFVFKVGDDVIIVHRVLCDTGRRKLPLKRCKGKSNTVSLSRNHEEEEEMHCFIAYK